MAKRFTSTELWKEDWFLEMPNEYKLFWFYILSNCDHGGLFKVNVRSFNGLLEVSLTSQTALEHFNSGKIRIRVINNSLWLIEDFFAFQYGTTFNPNNPMHASIEKLYLKNNIKMTSIRGLRDLKEKTKEKEKDKEQELFEDSKGGTGGKKGTLTVDMVSFFKTNNPNYPVDVSLDYASCLEIAYKIADLKKWTKESVTNGKMPDVLDAWQTIVEFSKADEWFSTRSISDLNKEFQRLIQKMSTNAGTKTGTSKRSKQSSAISQLGTNISEILAAGGKTDASG